MKTSHGSALMLTLLLIALALVVGLGYITLQNNQIVETGAASSNKIAEKEIPPSNTATEPVDMVQISRIKSLIPNDDFCRVVNGEISMSDLYAADTGKTYEKYQIRFNNATVVPTVACVLKVNNYGGFVYGIFEMTGNNNVSIEIRDKNGNFKQILSSTYPMSLATLEVKDDVNFDGYRDALLTENVGASMAIQSYFVFDPHSSTFSPREDLSELPSPSFDAKNQMIKTYMHGSAATGTYSELSFFEIDGKYVATKVVSTQFVNPSQDDWSTYTVTKELKNGVLATTSVVQN